MFTSKKDQKIEDLKKENETLNAKINTLESELKIVDEGWLNCRIESENQNTQLLLYQQKIQELKADYSEEIGRLTRRISSEKTRRLNSNNANRRKALKQQK